MSVKNKAIADPSFTTSRIIIIIIIIITKKQQQSSPRKSIPRGFYRCDRPKQEEEEKKEGKKCQKVKPQI